MIYLKTLHELAEFTAALHRFGVNFEAKFVNNADGYKVTLL